MRCCCVLHRALGQRASRPGGAARDPFRPHRAGQPLGRPCRSAAGCASADRRGGRARPTGAAVDRRPAPVAGTGGIAAALDAGTGTARLQRRRPAGQPRAVAATRVRRKEPPGCAGRGQFRRGAEVALGVVAAATG
ncbi:hypothetical protein G6F23_013818 [Rhizopus arrhizus]|nr:hypothetical protein G6F23_013818 [Rhizopus arrhizus]